MTRQMLVQPLLAVAALTAFGSARAADLPPVQAQGDVRYLSGGIGADEARALQAEARHWPVLLSFAVRDGTSVPTAKGAQPAKAAPAGHEAWLANVKVVVTDPQKQVVLDTVSDGPLLLASLAPGRYQVQASFGGQTLTRELTVAGHGPARAVFVWPHSAEMAQG